MSRRVTEVEKLTDTVVSLVLVDYITLVANAVLNYILNLRQDGIFELLKKRLVVYNAVFYDLGATVGECFVGQSSER